MNLIQSAVKYAFILFLAFAVFIHCNPALASNLVDRPKRELLPLDGVEELSSSNLEIAEQLEILPLLKELYDRKNPPSRERKEELRVKIREAIIESHFDAESVEAEAQREQAILESVRAILIARRDRNVNMNNACNFMSSGTLNIVGSTLGFSAQYPPFSGNLYQMLSAVVSTGMSTYTLKQNAAAKVRGRGVPTVLAELFGRPVDENTAYPESVWRFLHGHSSLDPAKTRIQVQEEIWIARGNLEPSGSPRESAKIDFVCGQPGVKSNMTVNDIGDQIAMISDISRLVSRMTHHLRDLMRMIDSDIPI